jgi:hypothetical protein
MMNAPFGPSKPGAGAGTYEGDSLAELPDLKRRGNFWNFFR